MNSQTRVRIMSATTIFKTIQKRHSTRSFLDKPIGSSKIKKILDASIASPSAKGLQSYKIYLVRDGKKKERLVHACHDQEYVNTPLLLVFCTEPKKIRKEAGARGERLLVVQDATIAASYAQLAAAALGLSSVWIGNFNEKQVAKIIRTKLRPVVVLPIGYEKKSDKKHNVPHHHPHPPKKKTIQDMIKRV